MVGGLFGWNQMTDPINDFLKLSDAATILNCEIEDILEKCYSGDVFLAINFIPAIKVFEGQEYYSYSFEMKHPPYSDHNLTSHKISGCYYIPPSGQKTVVGNFLDRQYGDIDLKKKRVWFSVSHRLYEPHTFNKHYVNGEPFEDGICDYNYYNENPFDYELNIRNLKISRSEIERIQPSKQPATELGLAERDNLLLTIGAIVEAYAKAKNSPKYNKANTVNIYNVVQDILQAYPDIHGLGKSALQDRISKGLEILKTKK